MDFSLNEEQEELRDLAGRILGEIATTARIEQVEATEDRFDRDLWAELARAGLLGVALPEDVGGLGLGLVELALVCEQLGRVVAPVPLVWTTSAALAVAEHGTDEQRVRWVAGVSGGDTVLTSAVPSSVRATVTGDRMTGSLTGVSAAHIAATVLVPVDGRLYAVDPWGSGVSTSFGTATNREVAAEIDLDDAPVEAVGDTGAADWLWQRTAVLLCAVQTGITEAAVRLAADYTSQRLQFGKPLSMFQAVAHRAADGYMDNAGVRATMLQAAWCLDRGDDARADVLAASWWAAEAGQRAVHATQHIHGGIGADITYPVHRYFLWGKQIETMLGGPSATLASLGRQLAATP